jgi:SAM-dependent methyltransferase
MNNFNSLYADHYDQVYAEKNYVSECDLIEEAVNRFAANPPKTLLDVGCGTGNHAIELAARGYRVTGVDLSQPMLDRAVLKVNGLDKARRPAFICGDARHFETGQLHDIAIMMFAVVGYLTTNDDLLAALRNIRRHLKSGSLFICDFWYGPSVLSMRPTDRVRELSTPEGRVIRAANTTLDIVHHTADVTFKLWSFKDNQLLSETTETHRMRYFFPQEFALLLSVTGFIPLALSAFPSLCQQLTDNTWNAFSVASAV